MLYVRKIRLFMKLGAMPKFVIHLFLFIYLLLLPDHRWWNISPLFILVVSSLFSLNGPSRFIGLVVGYGLVILGLES